MTFVAYPSALKPRRTKVKTRIFITRTVRVAARLSQSPRFEFDESTRRPTVPLLFGRRGRSHCALSVLGHLQMGTPSMSRQLAHEPIQLPLLHTLQHLQLSIQSQIS